MSEAIENDSLQFVDATKQSFFDFILNLHVVGYEIVEDVDVPIVKPVLIHGNYQDIYNKLMNAQLVIGMCSPSVSITRDMIGQMDAPLGIVSGLVSSVVIDKTFMVGGMPMIIITMQSTYLPQYQVCLDRYNRAWNMTDDIPLDTM